MDIDAILMLIFAVVVIYGGLFVTISRATKGGKGEKKKRNE